MWERYIFLKISKKMLKKLINTGIHKLMEKALVDNTSAFSNYFKKTNSLLVEYSSEYEKPSSVKALTFSISLILFSAK